LDDGESDMSKLRFIFIFLFISSLSFANEDILFPKQWNLTASGQQLQRDLNDLHSEIIIATGVTNWGYDFWIKKSKVLSKKNIVVAVLDSGIDRDHPDLKGSILPGINFARDENEKENDVFDYTGHGTHVSGIIAAQNNLIGVSGFGSFVKILPIKIFNKKELKYKKSPLSVRIAKGIRYATSKKVDA
jgi:subtilisin family serine protease